MNSEDVDGVRFSPLSTSNWSTTTLWWACLEMTSFLCLLSCGLISFSDALDLHAMETAMSVANQMKRVALWRSCESWILTLILISHAWTALPHERRSQGPMDSSRGWDKIRLD